MRQACTILILFLSITADSSIKIELKNEVNGLDIYYSFDNSYPDKFYPKYTQPLIAPKEATQIKVITYRDGKPIGRMISMPLSELKSGLKEVMTSNFLYGMLLDYLFR